MLVLINDPSWLLCWIENKSLLLSWQFNHYYFPPFSFERFNNCYYFVSLVCINYCYHVGKNDCSLSGCTFSLEQISYFSAFNQLERPTWRVWVLPAAEFLLKGCRAPHGCTHNGSRQHMNYVSSAWENESREVTKCWQEDCSCSVGVHKSCTSLTKMDKNTLFPNEIKFSLAGHHWHWTAWDWTLDNSD